MKAISMMQFHHFQQKIKRLYFEINSHQITGFTSFTIFFITKKLDLNQVTEIVRDVFDQIAKWDQEIPGAKKEECGNYSFMDLNKAKASAKEFVNSKWHHQYHYL